jgi:hypothetical protein
MGLDNSYAKPRFFEGEILVKRGSRLLFCIMFLLIYTNIFSLSTKRGVTLKKSSPPVCTLGGVLNDTVLYRHVSCCKFQFINTCISLCMFTYFCTPFLLKWNIPIEHSWITFCLLLTIKRINKSLIFEQ